MNNCGDEIVIAKGESGSDFNEIISFCDDFWSVVRISGKSWLVSLIIFKLEKHKVVNEDNLFFVILILLSFAKKFNTKF